MRLAEAPSRLREGRDKLTGWWRRTWANIRPGPEARRGGILAIIVTAAVAAFIGAWALQSGFGFWLDFLFAYVVAALVIGLSWLVVALLLTILRRLPRTASGIVAGSFVLIGLLWGIPSLGAAVSLTFCLVEGVLGATLATMFTRGFGGLAASKRIVTVAMFVLAVAGNAFLLWFFWSDGTLSGALKFHAPASPQPAVIAAQNPAGKGPLPVKVLFYGHGDDLRRPEYGKSVSIKTPTVDASLFFKDFKGWKAKLRKHYWGFGVDKLPLNARVWYPDGPGPYPLVLIVHGNHQMSDFSDPGYEYLGQLLASRGFILASIDENFLNSGLFADLPKEQAVRGWMLLEHLNLWRQWNHRAGNPFFGRVDFDRIALMGHSRGGEAAATAALFNRLAYDPDDANIEFHYGFPIKSVVAIAPVDGQYKPAGEWRFIENLNYFTIQGANDGDVSNFDGSRQFDHVRFTDGGPWFKAELYIYGANHGQFNTGWGRSDVGRPLSWFLNIKPLLTGEAQRQIAMVYLSAFLEATLHQRSEYVPLFRDYRRGRQWLPDTLYLNRFAAATDHLVSDFNEDADLTTTTVPGGRIHGEHLSIWKEERIPWRDGDRGYNGVFLGWDRTDKSKPAPTYAITIPGNLASTWGLGPQSSLRLSVAVTDEEAPPPGKQVEKEEKEQTEEEEEEQQEEPTDFTVELQTANGATAAVPVSEFVVLPPPFKVRFTKWRHLDTLAYKESSEPVFQTIDIPLAAFARKSGFDASKVTTIRLRFDRTPSRVVILSQVSFGTEP